MTSIYLKGPEGYNEVPQSEVLTIEFPTEVLHDVVLKAAEETFNPTVIIIKEVRDA